MVSGLPDFIPLVKRCGPSVVNISSKQGYGLGPQDFGAEDGLPEDSPLYDFFRRFFGEEGGPLPEDGEQGRSLGSGFILSPDGYILTNAHVVEAADEIIVRMSDRREFVAQVIGADERSDIALLKIEAADLPAVELGDSSAIEVGEWVLAIGSPFGFEHSATAGIISAKGRSLPSENYVPFIQTDVAINPGNSGGPLFDLSGRVVGVNSQIYSRTGGFMGLSFAIPIDVAIDVVEQLKEKGRVSRGWLGVLVQDVTRDLAEPFGLVHPTGALVSQVLPNSPAEKAGLRAGDIILTFDGIDVPTSSNLPPLVGVTKVDVTVEVELLRHGERRTVAVTLAELPEDEMTSIQSGNGSAPAANRLGLVVTEVPDDQRELLALEEGGVLVDRVETGPAERAGLRAGDLILNFHDEQVRDLAQFERLVDTAPAGESVAVLVQRGDGRMFYALRLPPE
ncbi:serine peptidase [Halochromatium salexigens]|uniref:Probable periplasmic serine endoprotease DegP-like n=2 Tax=Halochromatium salexigens TaxID=49447 RepID=A0AAJ0UII8_HALSE|nr:serine peptidase [Halochromatium salexigens]